MTTREVVFGLVGAVLGAVATYVVMDRLHERELDDIYSEMEDTGLEIHEIIAEAGYGTTLEDAEDVLEHKLRLVRDAAEDDELGDGADEALEAVIEDIAARDIAAHEDDAEVEDRGAIYIIKNEEVTDRQVVLVYDHESGNVEVQKGISVDAGFDEVIENDALYSLLGEEAYDILFESEPVAEGEDKRVFSVRNDVINLDFVISY